MPAQPIAVISSRMHVNLAAYVDRTRESFCKSFALIARFAGWTWNFKPIEMDDIYGTYDSIVNECFRCMDKMTDADMQGANHTISVSTGRIKCVITYYVHSESIIVNITADIVG